MFYRKKNYPGRWLVKLLEAGLIFGIVLFGLDALANLFVPQQPLMISSSTVRHEVRVPHNSAFTVSDYFNMGLTQHERNNYYESIRYYTQALNLDANHPSSRLNRGVAYEQLNQSSLAMHDYNRFMNRASVQSINATIPFDDYNIDIPMVQNRVYEFSFRAEAGQTLSVTADGSDSYGNSPVDPLIVVVDKNGKAVAGDDDTLRQDGSLINMNPSLEEFQILKTGDYVLRVSHAGGGSYGSINLDFNLDEGMSSYISSYYGYDGCGDH